MSSSIFALQDNKEVVRSDLGCMLKVVVRGAIDRTLVNHSRRSRKFQAERKDPMEGMFPDSFRNLNFLRDSKGEGKLREFKSGSVGRKGFLWLSESEIPGVVIAAFDLNNRC